LSEPAGQRWSAKGYAANARFVADLGSPVLDLLAPGAGERILDLGCGDGALTERIAATGAIVTGYDASPELVAAAHARGLDAVEGDGHDLPYQDAFDAVFSNAALHWMLRPAEVVAGVGRALVGGGRFVGEFGGFSNVAAITTALRAALCEAGVDGMAVRPWYFPTAGAYERLLERHGFEVVSIALIPRPTALPSGMSGWLDTFAAPFLSHLPEARRPAAKAHALALLEPALCDDNGQWLADYVRLRFKATLRQD